MLVQHTPVSKTHKGFLSMWYFHSYSISLCLLTRTWLTFHPLVTCSCKAPCRAQSQVQVLCYCAIYYEALRFRTWNAKKHNVIYSTLILNEYKGHVDCWKCVEGGLTVWVGRVVVEDAASAPVEAAHHHKVTLVFWLPAEALLAHRQETAVLDRRRAEFTHQNHSVDQHYGHMALVNMFLDFLNCHRATGDIQKGRKLASLGYFLSRSVKKTITNQTSW